MSNHSHTRPGSSKLIRPLLLAISITASFTVIEFLGGLFSGSLSLMSDAGHMFTDSLALALSLGAVWIALRPPTEELTFGYIRTEILAALVNGATLIILSVVIFYEAISRLFDPPEIQAPLMLIVALAGLGANAAGIYILHDKSKSNLNVKGAFLHMVGDLLSSIAVIIGAIAIYLFDFLVLDPLLSILIGAIILYGAWKLVTQSTSILLESVPSHLQAKDVKESLMGINGVSDVHDLHIWTLTSGLYALSAHIAVKNMLVSDCSGIISKCEGMLRDEFNISHTTLQLECERCPDDSCVFQQHK